LIQWAEKQSAKVPEHRSLTASEECEWQDGFWDCGVHGTAGQRWFEPEGLAWETLKEQVQGDPGMARHILIKTIQGIKGPFSSQQIREFAANGALTPDDEVSEDGKKWFPALHVRGLHFPKTGKPASPGTLTDEDIIGIIEETRATDNKERSSRSETQPTPAFGPSAGPALEPSRSGLGSPLQLYNRAGQSRHGESSTVLPRSRYALLAGIAGAVVFCVVMVTALVYTVARPRGEVQQVTQATSIPPPAQPPASKQPNATGQVTHKAAEEQRAAAIQGEQSKVIRKPDGEQPRAVPLAKAETDVVQVAYVRPPQNPGRRLPILRIAEGWHKHSRPCIAAMLTSAKDANLEEFAPLRLDQELLANFPSPIDLDGIFRVTTAEVFPPLDSAFLAAVGPSNVLRKGRTCSLQPLPDMSTAATVGEFKVTIDFGDDSDSFHLYRLNNGLGGMAGCVTAFQYSKGSEPVKSVVTGY
jgi:hypothetical protein